MYDFDSSNTSKMLGNLEVYFKSNQFTMATVNFFLTLAGYVHYQVSLRKSILCNIEKSKIFLKRLVPGNVER